MSEEEAKNGIAPYDEEIEGVQQFLLGRKSQHEFDKQFPGKFGIGVRPGGMPGDGFLLGGAEGWNTRDFWIDLLQHMVFCGMVEQKEERGLQYYRVRSQ